MHSSQILHKLKNIYDCRADYFDSVMKNSVGYHNENGPAVTLRDKRTKKIVKEIYMINNIIHRDNGPAVIEYNFNEDISSLCFYNRGELHRINGPAFTTYKINHTIKSEHWFVNGKEFPDWVPKINSRKTEQDQQPQLTSALILRVILEFDREYGTFLAAKNKEQISVIQKYA